MSGKIHAKTTSFRHILAVLLLSALSHGAWAQVQSGSAFLKVLPGARQQGLGSSLTGALDESYALYANPGAIGLLREWQWAASYTEWIADIFQASVVYNRQLRLRTPWSDRLNLGLGVQYQGVRQFDSSRGNAPSASARDILLSLSLGSRLKPISKNLAFGVNLKYFRTELAQFSAKSLVYDLGLLYRTPRFRLSRSGRGLFDYGILSAGVSVTQLGRGLKFVNTTTPLPTAYGAGVALNLGTHDGLQVQLALDYRDVRDGDNRLSFGTEVKNLLSPFNRGLGRFMDVRGGYNFNETLLSKFSFGVSIRLDDYMATSLKNVAPRNSALRFDLAVVGSDALFSPVYRGSVSHKTIRPEHFTIAAPARKTFSVADTVALSWHASRDPDLYDEVNYVLLLAAEDSLGLAQWVADIDRHKQDLFARLDPQTSMPDGHPAVSLLFVDKGENSSVEDSLRLGTIAISSVETRHDLVAVRLPKPLAAGTYFWSVMAYDRNHHVRFAGGKDNAVSRFSVAPLFTEHKPDLTISMQRAVVTRRPDALSVDLEPIRFVPDSFRVDQASKRVLQTWVALLSPLSDVVFEIAGHTDMTGPGPLRHRKRYNLRLSQERAQSVFDYLVSHGVRKSILRVVGYGESKPVDPRPTREAWARNRRVEIRLLEDRRPPALVHEATLTYTNSGNAAAENVQIVLYDSDVPQPEFRRLLSLGMFRTSSLSARNGHGPSSLLRLVQKFTVDRLEPGQSHIHQVVLDSKRPYLFAVIDPANLIAESDETNNWDEDTLPLSNTYDIGVEQFADEFIIQRGDTLTYHITIYNHGPGLAQDIVLTDLLPEWLRPVEFSVPPVSNDKGEVVWHLDSLAANTTAHLTFKAKVRSRPPDQFSALVNTARLEAKGDFYAANNIDSTTAYATQIQFAFRSADLTPQSKSALTRVAESLKRRPGIKFEIAGHASLEPVPPARLQQQYCANLKLSQARADSVRSFLIGLGLPPENLISVGYGHLKPRYDNATLQGRAKNRRVELTRFRPRSRDFDFCE
ncbi:MAG: DUF11 domain-containing protein [Calditrichaeota bacterium]|nr:MAG: DUF11 domain-containing protein [Calditrichota bacterium]